MFKLKNICEDFVTPKDRPEIFTFTINFELCNEKLKK